MSELTNVPIGNLFTTPFVTHVWPNSGDLNKELRQRILDHERQTTGKGVSRSNVGGWHSEVGQLEYCGAAGQEVIQRMVALANHATTALLTAHKATSAEFGWTIGAWANVNRVGEFNRQHIHGLSTWSGTYYVDPGDPPPNAEHGTTLELMDPNALRSTAFFPAYVPAAIYIRPEPGLMVVFPSYVPHMVFPHYGKRPRISIAINLKKDPFP